MIRFKLVQLKNKPNKQGEYPIFLRMTKNRKQVYIHTTTRCKESEWDKDNQVVKSRNDRVRLNNIIQEKKNSVISKFNSLDLERRELISVDEFKDILSSSTKHSVNIFQLFDNKIEKLIEIGKIGNARYYKDSKNSVKNFTKSNKLNIHNINHKWLSDYQHYLSKRECKESTIAARMRAIRAIFNKAIKDGIISKDKYPFGDKYKIHQLKSDVHYRALPEESIKAIKNMDIKKYPHLKLSVDLFLFSYYARGINFKDMMLLKRANISNGNRLNYTRSKTNVSFSFNLHKEALRIANYYIQNRLNTEYLFPILLHNNLNPSQIEYRKHKTISKFNKDLKEIAEVCGIEFKLTSYVARHSFASNLKEKNVPTDKISQAMGHKNIQITQVYLKKFNDSVIESAVNLLD